MSDSKLVTSKTYITALSTDECLQRLKEHSCSFVETLRFAFARPEKGTVFATIRGGKFRLFAQGPKYVSNSFAPFFYGRLESTPAGTRIHGRFQMHRLVRVFMTIWFAGVGSGTVAVIAGVLSGGMQSDLPPYVAVGTCLLMLLFGVGLVRFGQWIARGQLRSLQDFIQNTLEAQSELPGNPNN